MLIIRLQRAGKKNQPFFRIVVAEKTAPIKGKFLEKLGFLNPIKKEFSINEERVKHWTSKGAEISDSVYNILIDKKVLEGKKKIVKITKKKDKKEKAEGAKETGEASGKEKPEEKKEQTKEKEGEQKDKKEEPKEEQTKKEKEIKEEAKKEK